MGRERDKIIAERDDLAFIKDPYMWPGWLCPIKRRVNNQMECAYLFCDEPVIKHGNIFAPGDNDKEERFETHQAILAAGWMVD